MTEPVQSPETPAPAPVEAPAAPEPTLEELAATIFKPEGDPEPEPVVEAEPEAPAAPEDPKVDRVAARITAAKRAEQKAALERRELQTLREQQEKRQADLDAREKRIKLVEDDPVRFFEEFKSDPKAFLEKLSGEYKPENVVAKKADALEAKVAELEKRLAEKDEAVRAREHRAQTDQAWKAASAAFIVHVGEQAEKYPHLTEEFTEEQATEMAFSVLTEVVTTEDGKPVTRAEAYNREFGTYPDNDVVAEFLDTIAKQRVDARTKSAWRKRGESATPASQAPNGDPKPVPPVNGTRPRTLTSREASQRAAAPKPWTQEAADEESLRILEQALKKAG